MLECNGFRCLLAGDLNNKDFDEYRLAEKIGKVDILKVGHHGSSTSTSKEFLDKATPDYAAISVGENNIYAHPSESVVETLKESGTQIFRTDTDGDITFFVENGEIKTETEK